MDDDRAHLERCLEKETPEETSAHVRRVMDEFRARRNLQNERNNEDRLLEELSKEKESLSDKFLNAACMACSVVIMTASGLHLLDFAYNKMIAADQIESYPVKIDRPDSASSSVRPPAP